MLRPASAGDARVVARVAVTIARADRVFIVVFMTLLLVQWRAVIALRWPGAYGDRLTGDVLANTRRSIGIRQAMPRAIFNQGRNFRKPTNACASMLKMSAGVKGARRSRLPVASKIALAIAGATTPVAGSPAPISAPSWGPIYYPQSRRSEIGRNGDALKLLLRPTLESCKSWNRNWVIAPGREIALGLFIGSVMSSGIGHAAMSYHPGGARAILTVREMPPLYFYCIYQ
jgi:hypothetical protein